MPQTPPPPPPVSQRGPLVLIVDDDARSARVIAQMLREDGFNVEVALDGARAIARLTHAPLPDVLVTDLSMPHADGNSVTMFARAQKPGLPVIFVTGYPNLATSLAGQPSPTLFTKPVDYAELKKALLALLPVPGVV
jgi:CheY-like chemotaxis protein